MTTQPDWISPRMYELCKKCWRPMHGINRNPNPARTVCEPCGGNQTPYDAQNPHPDGLNAKKVGL